MKMLKRLKNNCNILYKRQFIFVQLIFNRNSEITIVGEFSICGVLSKWEVVQEVVHHDLSVNIFCIFVYKPVFYIIVQSCRL